MLKIFQAIANGKTVDIEAWKLKYAGVGLVGWSLYKA